MMPEPPTKRSKSSCATEASATGGSATPSPSHGSRVVTPRGTVAVALGVVAPSGPAEAQSALTVVDDDRTRVAGTDDAPAHEQGSGLPRGRGAISSRRRAKSTVSFRKAGA
eukprot:6259094-Alexandrium_andersonii.AAC.1